ncbi:non-ribosomal peptide synthetase, partial [Shewanella surugensis]
NIALVFEGSELTYDELNQRANQLAHHIRSQYQELHQTSLKPDTLIALYLDRSLEMVISILAVLKAGGAYVPIAPEYPQARTTFMLEDTAAPFIITQAHYEAQLSEWLRASELDCTVIPVNGERTNNDSVNENSLAAYPSDNLFSINRSSDLAYVIYTSGTTGQPKGVMIEHTCVINYLCSLIEKLPSSLGKTDFSTNYCFDLSVTTSLCPVLNGGSIYIYPENTLDIQAYEKHLNIHKINTIKMTPSMATTLLSGSSAKVEQLILGGEKLQPHHATQLTHIACDVIDEFGPTETTVGALFSRYDVDKDEGIGKPYANTRLFVFDAMTRLVPIGSSGELYIGGVGLARGYLNRPELTIERFIDNPFSSEKDIANGGTRLYKTGDLVRYLSDGDLEYLGRNDEQVKIRGHRIELGEIKTALERLGGIKQAVVLDYKSMQHHFLAAYIVPDFSIDSIYFNNDRRSLSRHLAETELTLDIEGIKQGLAASLPEYMIPTSVTVIEAVPLTLNGKLDKRALPDPMLIDVTNYSPPRNDIEQQLCQIWQAVLGLEKVGIWDDFFHIGGDSIKAISLVTEMSMRASFDVSLVTLFSYPKISSLCAFSGQRKQAASLLYTLTPASQAKEQLIMIHPGTAGAEVYHYLGLALAPRFNCIGIDNHNLMSDTKIGSLKIIALMYLDLIIEAKLHHRPINILGWSLGGNIALEMAYQLELRGYTDVQVYLLDTVIHNDATRAVLDKLDEDIHSDPVQMAMGRDVTKEYLERVLEAAPFENDIHQERLSGSLNHSRVTLFKAEEMMCNEKDHEAQIEFDELINQLADNNIQTVMDNPLKIVPIKDKHHINIIEAVETISANIVNRSS